MVGPSREERPSLVALRIHLDLLVLEDRVLDQLGDLDVLALTKQFGSDFVEDGEKDRGFALWRRAESAVGEFECLVLLT